MSLCQWWSIHILITGQHDTPTHPCPQTFWTNWTWNVHWTWWCTFQNRVLPPPGFLQSLILLKLMHNNNSDAANMLGNGDEALTGGEPHEEQELQSRWEQEEHIYDTLGRDTINWHYGWACHILLTLQVSRLLCLIQSVWQLRHRKESYRGHPGDESTQQRLALSLPRNLEQMFIFLCNTDASATVGVWDMVDEESHIQQTQSLSPLQHTTNPMSVSDKDKRRANQEWTCPTDVLWHTSSM